MLAVMHSHTMNRFARLKHWQIFLIWITLLILLMRSLDEIYIYLFFELSMLSIFSWVLLIGKFYNSKNRNIKIVNYRENFWFIVLTILLIPHAYLLSNRFDSNDILIFFAIPGTFEIWAMFKIINYSAKAYRQFEMKKEIRFWNYFWDFLLLAYFIIGIWFIQPKINKLADNKND